MRGASSLLQKLHLTLQEAVQGTEVHGRCKKKQSFGSELLVPCPHTDSDTLREGPVCPVLRLVGAPMVPIPVVVPIVPQAVPIPVVVPIIPAAGRAEGERGLAGVPAACPGAAWQWVLSSVGLVMLPGSLPGHILVTHGMCLGNTLPRVSDVARSYAATQAGLALLFICCVVKGQCFLD